MDVGLIAWARRRLSGSESLPPLWLFTDSARLPDPCAAVARLPRGMCGVVLRHDADPERAALGRRLAAICRARRLVLVVAGDARLAAALHAGVHLRGGWRRGGKLPRLRTSSAHDGAELRRARRAGVGLAFLSPVFSTASHPGGASLGVARWCRLARGAGLPVAALGGIDGQSIRRLPRRLCRAAAAIGALAG